MDLADPLTYGLIVVVGAAILRGLVYAISVEESPEFDALIARHAEEADAARRAEEARSSAKPLLLQDHSPD